LVTSGGRLWDVVCGTVLLNNGIFILGIAFKTVESGDLHLGVDRIDSLKYVCQRETFSWIQWW
jgi:hypothetical protein